MQFSRNLLTGKRKYLFVLILLPFIAVIYVAFHISDKNTFDFARREILLRQIGHELLLQSGDSTSRVLPIKKISENEYQISFEKELTFKTDSLLNTTVHVLAKDPMATDYVVNVMNSANQSVTYGFAVAKNKRDDIVACKGRKQPKASYMIDLKFKPTGTVTAKKHLLLGSIPFLAFVGFIFLRSVKPNSTSIQESMDLSIITLGSVLFDAKHRKLIINEKTIDLTGTETRLLSIFASSPNEMIARNRLQKEIWEDEGVIVGRSLDMFISKLRKKLEIDPNINIVVVRGKGYRLEINA